MAKKRKAPPVWDSIWYLRYPKELREEFKKFHKANPRVYKIFKNMVYKTRAIRETYSGYNIFYTMRWHLDMRTKGGNFEINNDFIPIYIRTLIHNNMELLGFFELRRIRSRGIPSAEERRRMAEEEAEDIFE